MVAAKPTNAMAPPIVLVMVMDDQFIPSIKWRSYSNTGLNARLEARIYGKLKGKALEEAHKIVRDNGGLDIAGEYGSIEISKKYFEVDLKIKSKTGFCKLNCQR